MCGEKEKDNSLTGVAVRFNLIYEGVIMKKNKLFFSALIVCAGVSLLAGCGKDKSQEIYFLNFKPEIATIYEEKVAPAFAKENPGYTLKVVTAASGTYEQTLRSEIVKSEPPAVFQVNGPVGLANWKDSVAPLDDTQFYSLLADTSMALKYDGKVAAIPYAVEGYGIIYNDQEAYNRCKIGDFIRELNPVSEKSWNDDYAIFVYSDNPVLGRGGYSLSSNFGNNAGVFALSYGVGTPNDSYSFRPVLMLL